MKTRLLAASVALAVLGVTSAAIHPDDRTTPLRMAAPVRVTTSTTAATTTTTLPPTTTTTAPPPPPTTMRAPVQAAALAPTTSIVTPAPTLRTNAALVAGDPTTFAGFGAWVDVYDWSNEYTHNQPTVGPADVDRMAGFGVQTLYIQATQKDSASTITDPQLLRPIIDRAHARGMQVIAWYVPTFEDPALDLHRMLAMKNLGVEGIGVDIESRKVTDAAERNRRLVDLSIALRQHLPGTPIAAVVMPAVQMEVINPSFWPGFPYHEIAPAYDAWMPMDYWTSRTQASGYRSSYQYTAENIDRLRADVGNPNLPVHAVGGIADTSSEADIDGFHRAAVERNAIGGSVYDYHTTGDALWPYLEKFRR